MHNSIGLHTGRDAKIEVIHQSGMQSAMLVER